MTRLLALSGPGASCAHDVFEGDDGDGSSDYDLVMPPSPCFLQDPWMFASVHPKSKPMGPPTAHAITHASYLSSWNSGWHQISKRRDASPFPPSTPSTLQVAASSCCRALLSSTGRGGRPVPYVHIFASATLQCVNEYLRPFSEQEQRTHSK